MRSKLSLSVEVLELEARSAWPDATDSQIKEFVGLVLQYQARLKTDKQEQLSLDMVDASRKGFRYPKLVTEIVN